MKKMTITFIVTLLLVASAPFATAQRGGAHNAGTGYAGNDSAASSVRILTLKATNEQRLAFAKCRETTDMVRKIADQMVGPGTR
jgi:hypothetical protein